MMKRITFLFSGITTWVIIVSLLQGISFADLQDNEPVQEQEIGIIEHLGEYAPLDLTFVDSRGDTVVLDSIVDKPTIVSLVYYNCPGICSPLLSGKVDVLERLDMKPGVDYEAVTISFNPDDTPQLAREKKKNFFKAFRKGPFPEENWLWLTGDSMNIHQFTDAVGFKYKKVDQDYIHAGALIVLSKEGKISRYLRGIQFQPFDLKMALTEASEGRVGPTVNKVLLYCFSYDPEGKRYAFNFLRVFGTAFLVFLVGFIAFLTYQTKFRRNKEKD